MRIQPELTSHTHMATVGPTPAADPQLCHQQQNQQQHQSPSPLNPKQPHSHVCPLLPPPPHSLLAAPAQPSAQKHTALIMLRHLLPPSTAPGGPTPITITVTHHFNPPPHTLTCGTTSTDPVGTAAGACCLDVCAHARAAAAVGDGCWRAELPPASASAQDRHTQL